MKLAKAKLYALVVLVLSLLICFIAGITLISSPITALAEVEQRAGTDGDVNLISSADELYNLSQTPDDWGKKFRLTQDINLSTVCYEGVSWTSIGNSAKGFTGTFDGDDHKISGLYIDSTAGWQGLFGYVDNGTIKNLKVEGTVIGNGNVGGIVGYLNIGTVEKCSFEGTVKGGSSSQAVGGIAGYNHFGTIKKCSNRGGVSSLSMYTGGIVGQNYGQDAIVIDCENTATISLIGSASNCSTAGGIVGINLSSSKIINCSNTGKIGEGNYLIIGGIVGSNNGSSVTQCYNTGIVTGSDYIGGVAGRSKDKATITQCYNTGAVSGSQYIGGVAGQNDGATVMNCYNTATVTGSSNVGGLVGKNYEGSSKKPTLGTVKNCYNRGAVTGDNSGGVVGLNKINNSEGTVDNCYYLTNTAVGGINNADTDGATVKTEAVFNSGEIAWLLQHGQDTQVWGQWLNGNGHEKQQYPVLTSNLPQRVWKVSFVKNGAEVSTSYVNNDETLTPPAGDEWYDSDGNVFDSNVKVTKDMTLGLRVYFGGMTGSTITTNYGQSIEKNLDELMLYENGSSVEDKFTYSIENNGGISGASIVGNTLVIPDNVNVKDGGYTLQIRAHEKTPLVELTTTTANIALTDFGKEDVILSVNVIINKADQATLIIKDFPDSVTYLNTFTLTTDGGSGDGEVTWDVTVGREYASINSKGEVTISGVGYVEITATKSGGINYNDVSAKISFTVNKANQDPFTIKELPQSVTYSEDPLTTFTLETDGGSGNGTITWKVTDGNAYADIDANGKVTVKGAGTVEITATKSGGDNYYDISDKIIITINKANQPDFKITGLPQSITYNEDPLTTFTLVAEGGATGGAVTWEVTDGGAYAEIDARGNVTVKGAGYVEITATKAGGDNYNDIFDKISFTINKANQSTFKITKLPQSVTYSKEPLTTFTLETDGGSGTGKVTWEVTDGVAYAQIDSNGKVTVIGAGTVEITATKAEDNNYNSTSDKVSFTVNKANQPDFKITGLPQSVTYNKEPLTMFTLSTYGGADGGTVTWEVTDGGAYADIDIHGQVTIKGVGYVEITATKSCGDNYNDISDVINFTINKANQPDFKITGLPQSVTYSEDPVTAFTLSTEGGADGGTVLWEVTDGAAYADISANGLVTVKGAGTVEITATKSGGNNYYDISDKIAITINKANQPDFRITNLPNYIEYEDIFQLETSGSLGTGKITWKVTVGGEYAEIDEDGIVIVEGVGYVEITATNAGDDNYNAAIAMVSFTAKKENQEAFAITKLPASVTYLDSFTLETTGGSGNGTVTWAVTVGREYATINSQGEVTIGGVGYVEITATKAGGINYNDISDKVSFTINKAHQADFNILGLPTSVTYGDRDFNLTAEGGSGAGKITWEATDNVTLTSDGKTASVKINGAGEVTVTAVKEEDSNYYSTLTIVRFTINKANQADFNIINLPAGVTYGDRAFELTADGGSGTGIVSWASTGPVSVISTGKVTTVTVNGAGEVTVTATKDEDGNYNSVSTVISFTVNKANQAAFSIDGVPANVIFNDADFTLTAEGGSGTGKVTWVAEGPATVTTEGKVTTVKINGAGEVTVTATKAGDDNYNSTLALISFTVNKANQADFNIINLPQSVTFGDIDFELTADGGSGSGAITWEATDNITLTPSGKIATVKINGAGEVTVTATKAEDENYNSISTVISFTINKANQTALTISGLPIGVNYKSESFSLSTDGGSSDEDVVWSVTEGGNIVSVSSNGEVTIFGTGRVEITATKPGGNNYNDISTVIGFTVEKATPDYTVPEGLIAYYGDTLADVKLPEGWAWDDAPTTSVGSIGPHGFNATFTYGDSAYFNTVTVALIITVEKATPDYTVPTGLKATYGDTLADVALPEGWAWDDALTTKVGNAGERTFSATFTPGDTVNYNTVTLTLTVSVAKAMPEYTIPTGLKAVRGDTLADVKLPEGWAWVNARSTKVGKAGERKFLATFTPSDSENYQTVTVELTVTVEERSSNLWMIILLIIEIIILVTELVVLFIQIRKKSQLKKAQR